MAKHENEASFFCGNTMTEYFQAALNGSFIYALTSRHFLTQKERNRIHTWSTEGQPISIERSQLASPGKRILHVKKIQTVNQIVAINILSIQSRFISLWLLGIILQVVMLQLCNHDYLCTVNIVLRKEFEPSYFSMHREKSKRYCVHASMLFIFKCNTQNFSF